MKMMHSETQYEDEDDYEDTNAMAMRYLSTEL